MKESTEIDEPTHMGEVRWTPWFGPIATEIADERPWIQRMRLQTLRLLLALGTAALVFMAARSVALGDGVSWADAANAAFFGLLLILTFFRPGWLGALTWLGLASLFINAIDGLDFHGAEAIAPVHVLLPVFILYAALLGDLYMSLTAMAGVLGIYIATWAVQGDLDSRETIIMTNLMALTVFSGLAALGVWLRHWRLERTLDLQAHELRNELETRLRIQAMVTHDIRTPLTALVNAAALDDPVVVQEMADRIVQITDAAQGLTRGSGISPTPVAVADIWKYTRETFAERLKRKGQDLELSGDSELIVQADLPILCNSVIGNFLTNASKFSPRGSRIRIAAEVEGEAVRITVLDEGPGMPPEILQQEPNGVRRHSNTGTEGEQGTGYGLQIAALCAARMEGRVETGSNTSGGAISVLLPRVRARA